MKRMRSLAALRADHENAAAAGSPAARRDTKVSRKDTKYFSHPRTGERLASAGVKLMVRSRQAVLS